MRAPLRVRPSCVVQALVVLPGGGLIRARGETTVGETVFVRDDVIEGVAPSLPMEIIDI